MPVLTELNLYPVKSCAGIGVEEATVTPAGLACGRVHDREWMAVDLHGGFLTQRSHPRMALITPHIAREALVLRAPGMPPLELPLAAPALNVPALNAPTRTVTVWRDTLPAEDCGDAAAAWFSTAIGGACRLVRFAPHAKRFANRQWTGNIIAPNRFSDGYPFLVISQESLDDLNQKLATHGRDSLPMNRFRPNLVIGGGYAFDEDHAAEILAGEVVLKPVKPCQRCPIPSIDQASGEFGPDPLDILRTYRVDPRLDGGITFGMNAVLVRGEGHLLRVGQQVEMELSFQD
jgi:uncharacterized protein YcbX